MQDKIRELENQIAQDGFKLINADKFVENTIELTKSILNSHVYTHKLKLMKKFVLYFFINTV